MATWSPDSSFIGVFMSYALLDVCIVLLCSWWLLRALCTRVASQTRRSSFVSGSTHPMYFEASAGTVEHFSDDEPAGFMFQDRTAQLCSVGSRLLLLSTAIIVTLQATYLALGAYFTEEQLEGSFQDSVFIIQAVHTLLVPLLLYIPLSWCLTLTLRRVRLPPSCVGRLLVLGTVILSTALLAAGIAGIASRGNQLHAEKHFGVVVWRSTGTWTLAGTELSLLSPLVLALFTCAVGVCLWWRCGIKSTAVVQLLLLAGHFAVSVNKTAAFFIPNVWQSLFVLSLLHTDWLLWKRDDKAAHTAAQASAESRTATYAALLASHSDTGVSFADASAPMYVGINRGGGYVAPSPAHTTPHSTAYGSPPGSLQYGGPHSASFSSSRGPRELVY